ncbi:hypothetical protein MRS44_014474 [Fusarium solani]|uniref:uncharacterized protein n=1 Tax=Fusarium solani TaxID=169388 RepID=UPI0032C413D4|nr:hypothetical protein MRS44_014474 [Fusarium solani]
MRANVPTTISIHLPSSPAGKQRNHEVGSSNRSQCASVDGVGWWKERARNCSLRAKKHPSRLEGAVSKSRLLQKIGIPVFSPRRRQEGVRDTESCLAKSAGQAKRSRTSRASLAKMPHDRTAICFEPR